MMFTGLVSIPPRDLQWHLDQKQSYSGLKLSGLRLSVKWVPLLPGELLTNPFDLMSPCGEFWGMQDIRKSSSTFRSSNSIIRLKEQIYTDKWFHVSHSKWVLKYKVDISEGNKCSCTYKCKCTYYFRTDFVRFY